MWEFIRLTEVVTGIGQRGVRAEAVAQMAAAEAMRYLESGAAVGEHLADQLLVPMVLTIVSQNMHQPTTQSTANRFVNRSAVRSFDGSVWQPDFNTL